jgi:hypothetical protein
LIEKKKGGRKDFCILLFLLFLLLFYYNLSTFSLIRDGIMTENVFLSTKTSMLEQNKWKTVSPLFEKLKRVDSTPLQRALISPRYSPPQKSISTQRLPFYPSENHRWKGATLSRKEPIKLVRISCRLWVRIFQYLGPDELVRCCCVCKEWRDAIYEDHAQLWRPLFFRMFKYRLHQSNILFPQNILLFFDLDRNSNHSIEGYVQLCGAEMMRIQKLQSICDNLTEDRIEEPLCGFVVRDLIGGFNARFSLNFISYLPFIPKKKSFINTQIILFSSLFTTNLLVNCML